MLFWVILLAIQLCTGLFTAPWGTFPSLLQGDPFLALLARARGLLLILGCDVVELRYVCHGQVIIHITSQFMYCNINLVDISTSCEICKLLVPNQIGTIKKSSLGVMDKATAS